MTRLAILMTCHNRKAKTLASLEALMNNRTSLVDEKKVFLVDDGSADGTGAAVRERFPEVEVIEGDGHLFWSKGTRLAFSRALAEGCDFYLWLNDDTLLFSQALETLLSTSERLGNRAIVVGSCRDPETGVHTYGGVANSRWRPFQFEPVLPGDVPLSCDTMNGNCVLIPREAARLLENVDPSFTHSIGDFDYGLRAKEKSCSVWVAPGVLGSCPRNPVAGSWQDSSLPFSKRWKEMMGPKGIPWKEWGVFARRHGGLLWPLYRISPYLKMLLTAPLASMRRPKK